MQIAVGGCLAQKDRGEITRRAPWVDVVFGTHNIGSLPALLERARHNDEAQVEILESLEVFPSTLPTRRESPYAAWVSISVGCNNTCTFCIVPSLRGTEKDRRPGDVLAEVEALVAEGVLEVTLLGQNVNSYGVEFGDRLAFGKLLRACGEIDGLERVRFTSPHPKDFTDDVIAAMAETPNVMPSLHMPLQSGLRPGAQGDAPVLPAASATSASSTGSGPRCRTRRSPPTSSSASPARPRTTSRRPSTSYAAARFAGAFTFQYSPRPGTPAATLPDQVPKAVVQERYERLLALQEEVSWAGEQAPGRPGARRAGRRGRGTQGRRHPPDVRPRPGQPAGALRRPGRCRAAAARRRRHRRGHLRRPAPPGRRRHVRRGPPDPGRRRVADPSGRYAGPGRRAARHADGGSPAGSPGRRRPPAADVLSRRRSARTRRCSCPASAPARPASSTGCGWPATRRCVDLLAAEPTLVVVVGGAPVVGPFGDGAWGSLAGFGVRVPVGSGAGEPDPAAVVDARPVAARPGGRPGPADRCCSGSSRTPAPTGAWPWARRSPAGPTGWRCW